MAREWKQRKLEVEADGDVGMFIYWTARLFSPSDCGKDLREIVACRTT
jgi:hypothetical protein